MCLARRACDWEQGERVTPIECDLVAAVRVRQGNTQQTTNCQAILLSETDDSTGLAALDSAQPNRTESGVHKFTNDLQPRMISSRMVGVQGPTWRNWQTR